MSKSTALAPYVWLFLTIYSVMQLFYSWQDALHEEQLGRITNKREAFANGYNAAIADMKSKDTNA